MPLESLEAEHIAGHGASGRPFKGTKYAPPPLVLVGEPPEPFLLSQVQHERARVSEITSGWSAGDPRPGHRHVHRHERPVDPVLLSAAPEHKRRGDEGPHGSHRRGHYRSPRWSARGASVPLKSDSTRSKASALRSVQRSSSIEDYMPGRQREPGGEGDDPEAGPSDNKRVGDHDLSREGQSKKEENRKDPDRPECRSASAALETQ